MGVKSNLLAAILCCNTSLSKEKGEDDIMKWTPKGNSSEAPIVVAARKALWKTGREDGAVGAEQKTRTLQCPT